MTTSSLAVQYVSDESVQPVSVIVPIDLWREIESERETAYLLKSETMKKRLLEAKQRDGGLTLDDARSQLGIPIEARGVSFEVALVLGPEDRQSVSTAGPPGLTIDMSSQLGPHGPSYSRPVLRT